MTIKRKNLACVAALCLFCAGCGRVPSIDVMGSFFPAWMICLTIAVILAFVVRYLLVRYRLESEVGPLALFYPSVVLLFSALLWLILYR
jgi:hypothetical protein